MPFLPYLTRPEKPIKAMDKSAAVTKSRGDPLRNPGTGLVLNSYVDCLLETAEDTGIVQVLVGNGGRTLMPALPPISSYHFSFESREESPPRHPVVRDSSGPSLELELTAGSWNLTVTALADTGSGLKETARRSAVVLVLGGMTSSITVQLGNERGALRYTVEFPATVIRASLALVPMGGGNIPPRWICWRGLP